MAELRGGGIWGDFSCLFNQSHLCAGRAGQKGVLAACLPRDAAVQLISGTGVMGRLHRKVDFISRVGCFKALAPHDLVSVSHIARSIKAFPQQVLYSREEHFVSLGRSGFENMKELQESSSIRFVCTGACDVWGDQGFRLSQVRFRSCFLFDLFREIQGHAHMRMREFLPSFSIKV